MQVQVQRKNYNRSIRSYIFVSIFVLVAACVYGYFQYTKLAMAQDAITAEQPQLDDLTASQSKFNDEYLQAKAAYLKDFQTINDQIESVFPTAENYTDLTITLDKFVNSLNKPTNPLTMNDLRYVVGSATGDYMTLPFNLSLQTTRSNFETFMRYIQTSGDLKDSTRLMDVKSLTMNFMPAQEAVAGETGASAKPVIDEPQLNVSMSLEAYYQKPAEGTTNATPAP